VEQYKILGTIAGLTPSSFLLTKLYFGIMLGAPA